MLMILTGGLNDRSQARLLLRRAFARDRRVVGRKNWRLIDLSCVIASATEFGTSGAWPRFDQLSQHGLGQFSNSEPTCRCLSRSREG